MIGDSNNETNFLHELLTDTQVLRLCEAFANGSSANIKLSRTQLLKLVQLGGFLGRPLASLMKVGLWLMKDRLTPLAKNDLLPLGVAGVTSAIDVAIQKKIHGFGMTALVISNEEMDDMKIPKSHEESGLLSKGIFE